MTGGLWARGGPRCRSYRTLELGFISRTRVFISGLLYWAYGSEGVMIACEGKYAAFAGAERMLKIVVAQRLPGDDQFYRVQLRGVSPNSSLRIGWVQLESATAPTNDLLLPERLLCAVRRECFTQGGVHKSAHFTIQRS